MVDRRWKLSTVVAKGDRRDSLKTLANKLAERLDHCPDENYAGLARQLDLVLAELDEMTEPEASKSDDLAQRRAARQSKANPPKPAAGN